ncbi:hypothetical protein GCM10019059_00080 [Camelimonas fluminis]|jgi:hypothetical protein|uniref:PepSY domain-containing protein n=1 Tax=Camelimonas fluminis TaxID=1576911 RepID=A0ABV7UDN4_9HYPH|nr:PepSY domain-containing protein [Camelimonas fluminis]GHE45701.1 hypothetical protein GCM10019059_00080 [Camelimonas fluminis]
MMKHIAMISLLLALTGVSPAIADDDCHVPLSQWQPREAVQKMAEARGWQVNRIRIDDGCYQIRGIDENGRPFKAKIDPATLSIVKMKRTDRHDDDHASGRRQSTGSEMIDASGALPSSKLFQSGELPKTVVK